MFLGFVSRNQLLHVFSLGFTEKPNISLAKPKFATTYPSAQDRCRLGFLGFLGFGT